MSIIRRPRVLSAIAVLALALWVLYHSSKGILFSFEHDFTEARPIDDELKIEYTKKALEADGISASSLVPVEINPGNVRWGAEEAGPPTYRVNIEQDGATIRCHVYQVK